MKSWNWWTDDDYSRNYKSDKVYRYFPKTDTTCSTHTHTHIANEKYDFQECGSLKRVNFGLINGSMQWVTGYVRAKKHYAIKYIYATLSFNSYTAK